MEEKKIPVEDLHSDTFQDSATSPTIILTFGQSDRIMVEIEDLGWCLGLECPGRYLHYLIEDMMMTEGHIFDQDTRINPTFGWSQGVNLLCREGNSQPGHWMIHPGVVSEGLDFCWWSSTDFFV